MDLPKTKKGFSAVLRDLSFFSERQIAVLLYMVASDGVLTVGDLLVWRNITENTNVGRESPRQEISNLRRRLGQDRSDSQSIEIAKRAFDELGFWLHVGSFDLATATPKHHWIAKRKRGECTGPRPRNYCVCATASPPGFEGELIVLGNALFRPVYLGPKPYRHFVGRNKALEKIAQRLRNRGTIVVVHGMSGMGKSSAAYRATEVFEQDSTIFSDGIIYHDLRKDRPETEAYPDCQLAVLGALDIPQPSRHERSKLYERYVEALKHSDILLVLDNVDDLDDARHLIPAEKGTLRASIAVTTQSGQLHRISDNTESIELDTGLSFDECADLWDRHQIYSLPETERRILDQMNSVLGGLPLAVDITLATFKWDHNENGTSFAEFVSFLNNSKVRAILSKEEKAVERILDVVQSLISKKQAYQKEQKQVFFALGACSAVGFHSEIVAKTAGVDDLVQVRFLLMWLIDHHIVRQVGKAWYQTHPLIKDVIQGLAGFQETFHQEHFDGVTIQLSEIINKPTARDVAEQYMASVREALGWGFRTDYYVAPMLALLVSRHCDKMGHWKEAHQWLNASLSLTTKDDRTADMLDHVRAELAYYEWRLGNLERSTTLIDKALVGEGDGLALAARLALLGDVQTSRGLWNEALDSYRSATGISVAFNEQSQSAELRKKIGDVYQYQGRYAEALEEYSRALLEFEGIDPFGESCVRCSLACVLNHLKRPADSRQHIIEAIEYAERMGTKQLLSALHHEMGRSYLLSSELDLALKHLGKSENLSRELGDRKGEGTTLAVSADCLFEKSEHLAALEMYAKALAIAVEVGDLFGQAVTLEGMGLAQEQLGERDKSFELLTEALHIFDALGHPQAAQLRQALAETD